MRTIIFCMLMSVAKVVFRMVGSSKIPVCGRKAKKIYHT
nr:unnamed protein product [Callosobruchus analis]